MYLVLFVAAGERSDVVYRHDATSYERRGELLCLPSCFKFCYFLKEGDVLFQCQWLLLLLLLMIWQSPGLPGWRKVNFITVTRRPHHPNIAAGLYCLATSPGFLPTLCEKWSGFFYVHRVFLSYTRDRRLKVSSERLGNEDKAPCPRALLPGRGSNRGLRYGSPRL